MATVKNINGTYTINSTAVTINGNLVVTGNTTRVQSTDTIINDNIITLNGNVTGSPVLNAAIEVNRGSLANVQLRWNETVDSWQITRDGTTFSNIATSVADGGLTVSANLNMNGFTIYSSSRANVTIDTNLAIRNTTVAPSAISGYNVLYMQTPSGGGSGLYVTNTTNADQELVTKTKAIVYALIM